MKTLSEKAKATTLLEKTAKSTLAMLVALVMSCAMTPTSAFAENIADKDGYAYTSTSFEAMIEGGNTTNASSYASNISITSDSKPSLSVLDASGSVPTFTDGAWNLTSGTYTVSGTSQSLESLRIMGDVVLNLNGATIDHSFSDPDSNTSADIIAQYAPAISIESGNVQMSLSGTNTTNGAPGCAGVYVAEGATLTILSDGVLNATGGNACKDRVLLPDKFSTPYGCFSGGAGIGGNGIWVETNQSGSNHKEIAGYYPNFGTVQIDGGTIDATGGNLLNEGNLAGGAGIGSGGCSGGSIGQDHPIGFTVNGSIKINAGTITATGGNAYKNSTKTGGGAGIGTGGVTGHHYKNYNNDVDILINGGKMLAAGKSDAAGIGGGANMDAGSITITDGQIIANGSDEENGEPWGGAGIGGGEESYASIITISGGTIEATGGGAAAGIGSGNHYIGDARLKGKISLTGSANVIAHSGPVANYSSYRSSGITANEISLSGQVNICVYSSGNAQGIVPGLGGLTVSGITSLWVQTENKNEPAIPSLGGISYSSPHTYLTTNWNYQASSQNPDAAYGWLNLPSDNFAGDKQFGYEWDESGLKIDGNLIPLSTGSHPASGSWATLYSEPYEVAVSYEYVDGDYSDAVKATLPDPTSTMSNVGFTAQMPSEVEGWTFDGWFTDDGCTTAFVNGTKLTESTVLYGKWEADPLGPADNEDPPIGPGDGGDEPGGEPGDGSGSEPGGRPGDDGSQTNGTNGNPQTNGNSQANGGTQTDSGAQTGGGSQAASGQDGKNSSGLAQTGDTAFRYLVSMVIALCGGVFALAGAARIANSVRSKAFATKRCL